MIVVAIIAILAMIALPSYSDYLKRGRIVDATNQLYSYRGTDGAVLPGFAQVHDLYLRCEHVYESL